MNSIFQKSKIAVIACAGWLLASGSLTAQDAKSGGGGGAWVLSYFLVLLGVVLGMLVVCRTSTRRDRPRPEGYTEGKDHGKEEK
jgi:hypothetical protein